MGKAGSKSAEYVARDAAAMSPSYTRAYPFVMDHGRGAEVWDVDGRRYLDFNAGIAVTATGHAHPEVVKAIQEQAAQFIHMSGTDFYYPLQIELAEKLNALAPGSSPKKLFFTNSGTESVEAAFKLARWSQRRAQMISFIGAFHGRSMGALSLTASKAIQKEGFGPLVPGVHHVPYAYCYRCPYNLSYPRCDLACVSHIERVLFKYYLPPREVAALIVEPIQGEGGYVVPPPEYHPRLKELCEKYGILYIADEVQTGIGRTGKMFAIEHWGVEPDIICLAKGIASGMPLGAMIAKSSIMTWPPGAHGSTFCGNPVSCAAALATLRLVQGEYMRNAELIGARMMEALRGMMSRRECIGDVRGRGLMIGLEIVKDKASKQPAPELRDALVQKCFELGLLILSCGSQALRFMPALNITADQADEGLAILEDALAQSQKC
jgi:4-aminobutyrate aminotransferase